MFFSLNSLCYRILLFQTTNKLNNTTIYTINVTNTCEKIVCGRSDTAFCPGQETFQRPFESNTKLLEHRAQSPVHEFILAVWPSITVIIQLLNNEIQLLNNYIYIFYF